MESIWEVLVIDDFILVDSGYREVDLAVLSQCNHTIMTIGTFSWWAAFLAGGDVVYYSQWPSVGSILYQMFNQSDFFMNNWIAMD
jgi:galactoside 2-L-fucosyltransferase 1/2